MKKFVRYVCMILVCGLLLAVPAHAESAAEARGSVFFASYGTDLYKTSATSFQIWFDMTANAAVMDVLGVTEIILYRSADQQSWTKMRTYRPGVYTQMLGYNTTTHTGYVAYTSATAGYYYRAYITFYAENSIGIGERYVYTEILQM